MKTNFILTEVDLMQEYFFEEKKLFCKAIIYNTLTIYCKKFIFYFRFSINISQPPQIQRHI